MVEPVRPLGVQTGSGRSLPLEVRFMFRLLLEIVHSGVFIVWMSWLLKTILDGPSSIRESGYADPLFWTLSSIVGMIGLAESYMDGKGHDPIGIAFTSFYVVMIWITRKNWRNRGRRKSLKKFGYKAQAARDKLLKNLKKIKVPVGLKPIPQPV